MPEIIKSSMEFRVSGRSHWWLQVVPMAYIHESTRAWCFRSRQMVCENIPLHKSVINVILFATYPTIYTSGWLLAGVVAVLRNSRNVVFSFLCNSPCFKSNIVASCFPALPGVVSDVCFCVFWCLLDQRVEYAFSLN